VQNVVKAVRDIRSKYNIPPGQKLVVSAGAPDKTSHVLNANGELICRLAELAEFSAGDSAAEPPKAAIAIVEDAQIYVHDVIDVEAERARFDKQRQEIEKAQKALAAKLANANFLAKAKPQVVSQTREKLTQLEVQLRTVEQHLAELNG
jgi:valyl-tRNA synthetase